MSPATATLIVGAASVVIQLLVAAFVYGQLTQKVKAIDAHNTRILNLEDVVSGPGGHSERITRLEAGRLSRAHHSTGD